MLSLVAIKTAANKLLKDATGLKTYGKEVSEGYDKPSLFVEIISAPFQHRSPDFAMSGFTIKITYFQETPDELGQLRMIDTVKEAFGRVFAVEERRLTVREITYEYVGQKQDILQISVDFEFYENLYTEPEEEIAKEMDFILSKKEED